VSFVYLTLIRIMFDSNSLMLASMPCGVFIPHTELVVGHAGSLSLKIKFA